MNDEELKEFEEELYNEKVREYSNEVLDAQRDSWINDNREDLAEEFLKMYNKEFKEFCNEVYLKFND